MNNKNKFPENSIFLVSYPKSGNTWLRFMIANYLTRNQCNFVSCYEIIPEVDYRPELIYTTTIKPLFIKSHSQFTDDYKRVIYLVRDGRDVAVSYYYHCIKDGSIPKETKFSEFLYKFNNASINTWTKSIKNWSDNVNSWLNAESKLEQFMLVRYEDLKSDPFQELERILKFADISVDRELLSQAIETSSFNQMQNLEKKQYKLHPILANSTQDILFIRKGMIGDYQNHFNNALLANFVKIHGSALERLGYIDDTKYLMTESKECWCGNSNLNDFSPEYSLCQKCNTLVSQSGLSIEQTIVENDQEDFYGKKYWFSHMDELGFPDIYQRSRQDLPERCVYWLCTLLKYKLPPAKVIELGCAHGGLVGLMKWAGFNAIGSEMSPWVVSFASETFDIPMLLGKIEDQKFELEKEEKFDAIILNDVLEHLPDPLTTMKYCASLLKEDGIFIIQMPCYTENKTYEEMIDNNDIFLEQLKADEHLYLFNKNSAKELLNRIGFNAIEFEEPIFYFYDMYLVASRKNIVKKSDKEVSKCLLSNPSGRLIQALIDKYQESKVNYDNLQVISLKNTETQSQLHEAQSQLHEAQSQLHEAQSQLHEAQSQLHEAQSQLHEAQSQLHEAQSQLHKTQEECEELRIEYHNLTQLAQQALIEINGMKSSKFWNLRQAWFKLKKVFGLSISD